MSGGIILKNGTIRVKDGGRLLAAEDADECFCCSPCSRSGKKPHKILYEWESLSGDGGQDLTPYRRKGSGYLYWNLGEGNISFDENGCFMGNSGSNYGSGAIDNGELIGLPDRFTSTYSYTGYMKLVIFCCWL